MLCRKSLIAIEYCYRYRQDHPETNVFWVYASNPARFAEAYHRIGRELGLPDLDNPDVDTLQLVKEWLSNDANGPWLLVLDNADDTETLFGSTSHETTQQDGQQYKGLISYLPQSVKGSMIVTTRDRRIGGRLSKAEKPITVLPFEMRDAKVLLQKTLQEDELSNDHSMELLEALGLLPMAITQAAAFIRENSISILKYLDYLRSNDKEAKDLLDQTYHDPARDPESRNSVFQTWKISFDNIRKQRPRAADILSLMAVLDRQAVQEELLREDNEQDIDFITAIGTLKAFSLITEEKTGGTFGIHRLIQLAMQRWLELEDMIELWQKKAIYAVTRLCIPRLPFSDGWKTWKTMSPHVHVVLGFTFRSEPFLLERAWMLHRLSIYELEQGLLENAGATARTALATIQKLGKLEGDNDNLNLELGITNIAAIILALQGKYEEAEKMHRERLDKVQRKFGSTHPNTLMDLDCLGDTLLRQGKYNEAEALLRRSIEGWTTSPENSTNKFRFCSVMSLAQTLEMQGRYSEAEENIRQAVDGHIEGFGDTHPYTTWCRSVQASIFTRQDKLEAADAVARQVLQGLESSLGPQHLYTARYQGEVALILEKRDKCEEAERLRRQAFHGLENLFGPKHSETINALGALARVLQTQHRYAEAEEAWRRVVSLSDEIHGPEFPQIFDALRCSALVLKQQAKYAEFEAVSLRAFHGCETVFGPMHPQTVLSLNYLVDAMFLQNKVGEVETVCRPFLDSYLEEPRLEDLSLPALLDAIAEALSRQGKYEEAERWSRQALPGIEEALGSEHPQTLASLSRLAYILEGQTKYEAAEAIRRRVLETSEKVNGPTHLVTYTALYDLAWILHMRKSYDQASILYHRARSGSRRKFGPRHPLTVNCSKGFATLIADNPFFWAPICSYKCRRLFRSLIVSKAGQGKHAANLTSQVPRISRHHE